MSVAVITGGASGIGRATATRLAERDWNVGILDIDTARGEDLAGELTAAGGDAVFLRCDTASRREVDAAVDAVVERYSQIDAAIACAAEQDVTGSVTATSEEDWRRSIDVNANGTYLFANACLPHLIAARGAFAAVSSVAGVRPACDLAAYNAGKAAVIAIVRSIALDYGRSGVRSNAICPGETVTPAHDRSFATFTEEQKQVLLDVNPTGRFASADEMAAVIVHLVSDEATYTNGAVYVADGGMTAGSFGVSFADSTGTS